MQGDLEEKKDLGVILNDIDGQLNGLSSDEVVGAGRRLMFKHALKGDLEVVEHLFNKWKVSCNIVKTINVKRSGKQELVEASLLEAAKIIKNKELVDYVKWALCDELFALLHSHAVCGSLVELKAFLDVEKRDDANRLCRVVKSIIEESDDKTPLVDRLAFMSGQSALHAAVAGGHMDCVNFLLDDMKANVEVESGDGLTPIFYAVGIRNKQLRDQVVAKLEAAGADKTKRTPAGLSLEEYKVYSCSQGSEGVVGGGAVGLDPESTQEVPDSEQSRQAGRLHSVGSDICGVAELSRKRSGPDSERGSQGPLTRSRSGRGGFSQ